MQQVRVFTQAWLPNALDVMGVMLGRYAFLVGPFVERLPFQLVAVEIRRRLYRDLTDWQGIWNAKK